LALIFPLVRRCIVRANSIGLAPDPRFTKVDCANRLNRPALPDFSSGERLS